MSKIQVLTLLFFAFCLKTEALSPALKLFGRNVLTRWERAIQSAVQSKDPALIQKVLREARFSGNQRAQKAELAVFRKGTVMNVTIMNNNISTLWGNMDVVRQEVIDILSQTAFTEGKK